MVKVHPRAMDDSGGQEKHRERLDTSASLLSTSGELVTAASWRSRLSDDLLGGTLGSRPAGPKTSCDCFTNTRSLKTDAYVDYDRELSRSPIEPQDEAELEDLFRDCMSNCANPELPRLPCEFMYKQRRTVGRPIHVAALHREGEALLAALLEMGAGVHEECTFRSYDGQGKAQAMHLASGMGNRTVLEALLQAGAHVDARSQLNDQENYTPLHEACFFSKTEVVDLLLKRGASPEVHNVNGSTPLHVAAKQGAVKSVVLLTRHGADLQAQNRRHETPLVVAVEYGFPQRKLHLLARRTMEDLLTVAQLCPEAAPEMMMSEAAGARASSVDPSWLKVLGRAPGDEEYSEDGSASGAASLVNNVGGLNSATVGIYRQFGKWRWGTSQNGVSRLTGQDIIMPHENWISLLQLAPRVAESLLEALTLEPGVMNRNHHPLPRRARLPPNRSMLCCYCPADVWEWDGSTKQAVPRWHMELAPGAGEVWSKPSTHTQRLQQSLSGRTAGVCALVIAYLKDLCIEPEELVTVQVRHVRLPGILHPRVLSELASTTHEHLFANLATQAIIEYLWRSLVERHYKTHILYRVLELYILMTWVLDPPQGAWKGACWSFLFVSGMRELLYEGWEVIGYCRVIMDASLYFTNWRNFLDLFSIAMLLGLAVRSYDSLDMRREVTMLAVVGLCRWVQLMYTLRAFPWAGQKILPIIRSFFSIGGIISIVVFVACGFLHAFLALELRVDSDGVVHEEQATTTSVGLATLRLLLLGDGDAIDTVLSLGGRDSTGDWVTISLLLLSVVIFCVCILNLFIAVLCEAYDSAQERAVTSFLQERASICLQCLLRPHAPGARAWTWRPIVLAMLVALPVWALLLVFDSCHPVVPSAVLLVTVLFCDALMVRRPWKTKPADRNYLWICHRTDYDAASYWPTSQERLGGDCSTAGRAFAGRRSSQSARRNHHHIQKDLARLQMASDDGAANLKEVTERLGRLEKSVDFVVSELRKASGAPGTAPGTISLDSSHVAQFAAQLTPATPSSCRAASPQLRAPTPEDGYGAEALRNFSGTTPTATSATSGPCLPMLKEEKACKGADSLATSEDSPTASVATSSQLPGMHTPATTPSPVTEVDCSVPAGAAVDLAGGRSRGAAPANEAHSSAAERGVGDTRAESPGLGHHDMLQ